jgi:intracellular sulfur oxidation DsrE/DsrF family protein
VTTESDFAGVKQAKAVWDFSTGDGRIFLERLRLIRSAIDLLRAQGIEEKFVVMLRGAVLKFVAKDISQTSFATEQIEPEHLAKIHAELEGLAAECVKIELCLYAMRKREVQPDNVLPFTLLEENVFANAIALQNKGYAFMQVD